MRHFAHLSPERDKAVFHALPEPFARTSDRATLALALGATLYVPATRRDVAATAIRLAGTGLTSMVLCLEDAVRTEDVASAEDNAVHALRTLGREVAAAEQVGREAGVPLLFVRVRHADQINLLVDALGPDTQALVGIVVPKFGAARADAGRDHLEAVAAASARLGRPLLVSPILETAEVARRETRSDALLAIRDLLAAFCQHVLTVRIGATDISGIFGLRRGSDTTVYDIAVVRDAIADIVSAFGRPEDGWTVSGPAWEFFSGARLLKPQLRQTPFAEHGADGLDARRSLIEHDLDGLIKEALLDRANGLTGKTVIHPSHVQPVHAVQVVSHEEYLDAQQIARAAGDSGVAGSAYGNKMNEMRPHAAWAARTLARARVFGVLRPDSSPVDLLDVA